MIYRHIILFDGHCNLCHSSIQFIIRHDKKSYYKFASLQSERGKKQLQRLSLNNNYLDSIVLIEGDQYYLKSEAILKIARNLDGFLPLTYIFILIPKNIRDYCYSILGRKRYRWFGKKKKCMLSDKHLQERFL